MTQEQIISKSKTSPALSRRVKSHYPAKFKGRVPLKVMITKTIIPELAYVMNSSIGMIAGKEKYYVWVNAHGYVYVILPDGKHLRLKPDEYDVIEWHNQPNK